MDEAPKNQAQPERELNYYTLKDSSADRERLVLQAKTYRPAFVEAISQAVSRYNLLPRINDPAYQFRVLDAGCGEGLYLPFLNQWWQEQEAKAKLSLVGIDRDEVAIVTAEQYFATLAVKNVQFYSHNLSQPLTQQPHLNYFTRPEARFDLVYALAVLMYLSNQQLDLALSQLYQALKPGGVIYLRDMNWESGYNYPSPAFNELKQGVEPKMLSLMGIKNFASQHQTFLSKWGFELTHTYEESYPVGGSSEVGQAMIRNFIIGQHAARPNLLKMGLIQAEEFDRLVEQLYREVNPEREGYIRWTTTLAQKPAVSSHS